MRPCANCGGFHSSMSCWQTPNGIPVQATGGPHVCTTGCSWPCPWASHGPHFAAAQPLTPVPFSAFAPPLSNLDVDRIARRVVDLLRESKAHIPVTNRDNGIRHDEGEG